MTDDNGAAKVHELIKGQRTAMLTTRTADGSIVTRPMACQDTDFTGELWFFAFADSDKAQEIAADPHVNVAFTQEGNWVSLSGSASVVQDPAKARELWNPFAEAWFQCEPEDPKVALIRVDANTAEYWDSPGKPGQVLGMLKAVVGKERPDMGDNETVELS